MSICVSFLDAAAVEPPDCEPELYGASISDRALEEGGAGVGDGADFAVYFVGDDYWRGGAGEFPPVELKLTSPGETLLQLQEFEESSGESPLYFYRGNEALERGSWGVEGFSDSSTIEVLRPPEEPINIEVSPVVRVLDSPIVRDNYSTLGEQAEYALQVKIVLPQEWTDRMEEVGNGTIFAVRLSLDEEPEATSLTKEDFVRVSREGDLLVYDGGDGGCWENITVDWYSRDKLYGLIWPLGLAPEEASLRFEVDLAAPGEQVDAIYGASEFDESDDEGGERGDHEGEGESNSSGCMMASGGGGSFALILMIACELVGRRWRRAE